MAKRDRPARSGRESGRSPRQFEGWRGRRRSHQRNRSNRRDRAQRKHIRRSNALEARCRLGIQMIPRGIRVVVVKRAVLMMMMRLAFPMHHGVREVAACVHFDQLLRRCNGLKKHRNQQNCDEEKIAHVDSAYQMPIGLSMRSATTKLARCGSPLRLQQSEIHHEQAAGFQILEERENLLYEFEVLVVGHVPLRPARRECADQGVIYPGSFKMPMHGIEQGDYRNDGAIDPRRKRNIRGRAALWQIVTAYSTPKAIGWDGKARSRLFHRAEPRSVCSHRHLAAWPSMAKNITVFACARSASARAAQRCGSAPCRFKNAALQTITFPPSVSARTPRPSSASNRSAAAGFRLRAFAASTIARAIGCRCADCYQKKRDA